jgi:hypothetical protein
MAKGGGQSSLGHLGVAGPLKFLFFIFEKNIFLIFLILKKKIKNFIIGHTAQCDWC